MANYFSAKVTLPLLITFQQSQHNSMDKGGFLPSGAGTIRCPNANNVSTNLDPDLIPYTKFKS